MLLGSVLAAAATEYTFTFIDHVTVLVTAIARNLDPPKIVDVRWPAATLCSLEIWTVFHTTHVY